MWMRLVSSDGATVVEVIRLSCSNRMDGEWLRVERHGMHLADVRTVGELAGLGSRLAMPGKPTRCYQTCYPDGL